MASPIHSDHPNLVFVGRDADIVPPRMPKGSDYPSILLVHAAPADIDPAELETLDGFGRALTERYDDEMGGPRSLANFAELERTDDGRWRAGKFTWQTGHRTFDALEGAIKFLSHRFEVTFPAAGSPGPAV
jgi:hypothetical protein